MPAGEVGGRHPERQTAGSTTGAVLGASAEARAPGHHPFFRDELQGWARGRCHLPPARPTLAGTWTQAGLAAAAWPTCPSHLPQSRDSLLGSPRELLSQWEESSYREQNSGGPGDTTGVGISTEAPEEEEPGKCCAARCGGVTRQGIRESLHTPFPSSSCWLE